MSVNNFVGYRGFFNEEDKNTDETIYIRTGVKSVSNQNYIRGFLQETRPHVLECREDYCSESFEIR